MGDGHGGDSSCEICVTSSLEKPRLEREFDKPEAGTWKISAWGKARLGDAGAPNKWKIRLGNAEDEGSLSSSSWNKLEDQAYVGTSVSELKARVELDSQTVGHCMLVDDIVITHAP